MRVKRENRLFRQEQRLLGVWDRMQRLQVDFCVRQEMEVLDSLKRWHRARRVLDVGTGNGHYLAKIARRFPHPEYVGIEPSETLAASARRELEDLPVEVVGADLAGHRPEAGFDLLLMRLFLQHMPEVGECLDHASRLADAGGAIVVIDALDAARSFDPPAEGFSTFFEAYTRMQRGHSRERRVGDLLACSLEQRSDWVLSDRRSILIDSSAPGNRERMMENYALFIDLVEGAGDLDYDFERVRRQWAEWCATEGARMRVGLDVLLLEKT